MPYSTIVAEAEHDWEFREKLDCAVNAAYCLYSKSEEKVQKCIAGKYFALFDRGLPAMIPKPILYYSVIYYVDCGAIKPIVSASNQVHEVAR